MAKSTRSTSAPGGDPGAAAAGTGAAAGAAPAAPSGPEASGIGAGSGPSHVDTSRPALDAATAAAAQLARGEPENVTRAAEAATGSALDAPGVGSGPAGRDGQIEGAALDPVRYLGPTSYPEAAGVVGDTRPVPGPAGVEPGLYDALGAHGARFDPAANVEGISGDSATIARRRYLDGLVSQAPTIGKLAVSLPADRQALADHFEVGFDFVVTSRQEGRRRAGVVHPTVPTLRRTADFTAQEIDALRRDPMLVVQGLS